LDALHGNGERRISPAEKAERIMSTDIVEFAKLVLRCLDEQQKYFRSKGDDRTVQLIRCKKLEGEVKTEALKILDTQKELL